MPHRVRVPVKIGTAEVGSAAIGDDGVIELVMHTPNALGQELLAHIRAGFVFGLYIVPIVNPAVDGKLQSRLDHQRPLPEIGEFKIGSSDY